MRKEKSLQFCEETKHLGALNNEFRGSKGDDSVAGDGGP